jgi:hypothetical protein
MFFPSQLASSENRRASFQIGRRCDFVLKVIWYDRCTSFGSSEPKQPMTPEDIVGLARKYIASVAELVVWLQQMVIKRPETVRSHDKCY